MHLRRDANSFGLMLHVTVGTKENVRKLEMCREMRTRNGVSEIRECYWIVRIAEHICIASTVH